MWVKNFHKRRWKTLHYRNVLCETRSPRLAYLKLSPWSAAADAMQLNNFFHPHIPGKGKRRKGERELSASTNTPTQLYIALNQTPFLTTTLPRYWWALSVDAACLPAIYISRLRLASRSIFMAISRRMNEFMEPSPWQQLIPLKESPRETHTIKLLSALPSRGSCYTKA